MTFYQIVFLFFAYSFLGWVGEVLFTAVVHRKYQDRGVLSGPLCLLYGVGGLVITFALGDIREGWFFLLVFSAVYATVIEWIGGHILEYTTHTRWWDYSAMPFNLDGYVCLGASLTWGALGVVVLKWGNPLLLALYSLVPRGIWVVVLLAALVVFCVDLVGTLLAMAGLRYRWPAAEAVENRLANLTVRGGMWILDHVERRMAKAHPALTFVRPKRQQTDTFAAGCSPYKIILLFFIGAFLGDITETIFCRVTGGEWMSRSSVVWGPFSIVWGLAIAMVTQLLYRYKDNADTIVGNMDSQIFLGGSEPTTLKDLSEMLGKETIDAFNTSDTRGNSPSYGTTFQKMGHELLSRDELAVLDGGKCILQLRGVRPFLSDKYDLTQHPNYKLTSDYDPKNTFDIEKYLNRKEKINPNDAFVVIDADSLPSA